MSKKFHINDKDEAQKCQATKKSCKFLNSKKHYLTLEEAQKEAESRLSANFDPFAEAMKKNSKIDRMQNQIDDKQKLIKEQTKILDSLNISRDFEPISHDSVNISEYNKDYSELKNSLTEAELESIKSYTRLSYVVVNEKLRMKEDFITANEDVYKLTEKIVKNLDSYLSKAPQKERILYRSISQESDDLFKSADEYCQEIGFEEGKEISFPEYLSTSIDPGHIAGRLSNGGECLDVVLVINSKSGAPVDYAHEEQEYVQDHEREILVPRNTKYIVNKIDRTNFYTHDDDLTRPLTVFLTEI